MLKRSKRLARVEVTILVARFEGEPLFSGFIDLLDEEVRGKARFEFRATHQPLGDDNKYTFTRLRRWGFREELSALGPCEDQAHTLFAAAIHTALGTVRDRTAQGRASRLGESSSSSGGGGELRTHSGAGVKVRFTFDPSAAGMDFMFATLMGPAGWLGPARCAEA